MKYFSLSLLFLFLSCGNKETVLLPKSDQTIVKNVEDHSPIYIFFRTKVKDTLAEVNKKNEIISTNWIFNIDKRLPLRIVVPEIMKLQDKKRKEKDHKNEKAENYYSYADSIGKNLAFLPFTKVVYKLEKPPVVESVICFQKNGLVKVTDLVFSTKELSNYLNNLVTEHKCEIVFSFDKNLSFGEYVQYKILISNLVIKNKNISMNHNKEFIY